MVIPYQAPANADLFALRLEQMKPFT